MERTPLDHQTYSQLPLLLLSKLTHRLPQPTGEAIFNIAESNQSSSWSHPEKDMRIRVL